MATLSGELVVLSGPYKGRRVPLVKDALRIGRDVTCDVALDDEAASRQHAEIHNRDGKLLVRDLNSTNGTFLNDTRIGAESILNNGDRVGIGDTIFLLQTNPGAERPAPAIVFTEEPKGVSTRLTLNPDETRFLELKEGTTIPDAQRHFTGLYEFMEVISGVLHRPALLERALEYLCKSFQADRGVIMLLNSDGETGQKIVRLREGLSADQEISISRTMAQQVLHKKESFLSLDVESDERLSASDSMREMKVQSVIGVPLKLKDRVLGMLYLDRITGGDPFSEMDLKLCTAMALQAAVCLENTTLYTELLDAAEFNNSILRSLSSGLMVVDLSGRIVRVNRAALEIIRQEESAVLNKLLENLKEISEMHGVVQATLSTGKPEDRYEVRIKAGGETIPLGLGTSVLADHTGRLVGVVANFRNLAPIRRLEEQVRRAQHLAALGQMAAGVAHEIRNPLNSIRGFTQLIQEAVSKETGPLATYGEYTQIVLEEVDRMNRIVQDLLDFSRQRELTLVPVYLDRLALDLLKELESEFKAAQITLSGEMPSEPVAGVLGNDDKLRQVLRNILLNALQASKPGGEVRVRVHAVEGAMLQKNGDGPLERKQRSEIAMVVTDQGDGMDAAILSKIFDPFFTTKDVGTGLGLSISQKIVDQHNGKIEVKSEPGKGATFTVFLPAV